MQLNDTIELMCSTDYKERFKAEYYQLEIRLLKLKDMLVKYEAGTLGFKPKCPITLLQDQANDMESYLKCLKIRAQLEDVEL